MKLLFVKLALMVWLTNPGAGSDHNTCVHTEESGQFNLETLEQIENLIAKKAGADFSKDNENSFTLNGHFVYTGAKIRKYAPSIYEESFYEIENPENEYRMRLIKYPNGDKELAVLIKENNQIINYHAAFNALGEMFEEDPWGVNEGYSIEIFSAYNNYRTCFSERVDAK